MDKLVSIIIPTFGRNKYIERAIQSALNQTYKAIEILVIDDNDSNSIQRTELELLMKKYVEIGVKYIKHEKNQNGAAARNTGIENSKGYYITFLDDDDIFLENRVEKLVKLLETKKEYDCAYSNVLLIAQNKLEGIQKIKVYDDYQFEILKLNSFIGTGSNIFFTKKAIKKIGDFDIEFYRHQDLEYLVRFLSEFKIIGIDEYLVIKDSSDKQNNQNLEKTFKIRNMYIEKFYNIIESKNKKDIYFSNYINVLADAIIKRNKFIEIECRNILIKNECYSTTKVLKKVIFNKLKSLIIFKIQIKSILMKLINRREYAMYKKIKKDGNKNDNKSIKNYI